MLTCTICGQELHVKNKKVLKCPLEPFLFVKAWYTEEFKGIISYLFSNNIILSDSSKGLLEFSKVIPETTELLNLFDFFNKNVYTSTHVIETPLLDFFLHFNKVLIEIYYNKRLHFIDSIYYPNEKQYNYLWLNPSTLRACYFGSGGDRIKTMSDLLKPSLVIYPIGLVMSYENKAWGDIVLDLITQRNTEGKPTWIIQTKPYGQCIEMTGNLNTFLESLSSIKLKAVEGLIIKKNTNNINNKYGNYL